MNPRQLLARVLDNPANIRFADSVGPAIAFGFQQVRVRGSHHVFKHSHVAEPLSIHDYQGAQSATKVRPASRM